MSSGNAITTSSGRLNIAFGRAAVAVLTGLVKDLFEQDIRMLSDWKGCEVIELKVQADHVHLVVSIPPRISVSEWMGTLKGKLAIKLFKSYPQLKKKPY